MKDIFKQQSSIRDIFFCPEESKFYSYCLEILVLNQCHNSETLIEFGSGDGSPVINSLLRTKFDGLIHGFEINDLACKVANSTIEEYKLGNKYIIYNQSLFDISPPDAEYLVSSPPYIPAPDNNIYIPLLHGGTDGSTLTKQLLSLDYDNVLLIVSSYTDPEGIINCAKTKEYYVSDFLVVPMPFGYYSSEQKVKNTIEELRKNNKAFYSDKIYLVAGILFKKQKKSSIDLSTELVKVMTAL